MIAKSESIYWAKVWWILAADNLTFEEVMSDFRKKYPADWFRGKKACKDIPGKNNILHWKKISLMTYIILKKYLTPIYIRKKVSNFRGLEKKIVTQVNPPYPSPQQKWNGQPHTGCGRSEFDTLVDVIRQQNSWRAFTTWWFSRLKFCISRLKRRR